MTLTLVLVVSLRTVFGADPTQVAFEVTEKRLENFKESQAELDRIAGILVRLGDPRKRQKGESTDQFFERVENIYRYRAQGLILLQMEYEGALRTRYELEADLKFYMQEVLNENEGFEAQQKQRLARRDAIKARSIQLADEVTIIHALIYRAAEKERRPLEHKENLTWKEAQAVVELSDDLKACEDGMKRIGEVPDRLKIEAQYAGKSLPELREARRDIEVRADAAKFEYQYLEFEFDPQQSADVQKLLGERYGKIFEDARRCVDETKDLEKRAARVAILARETRDRLREGRRARNMFVRRQQLIQFMVGEDRRLASLRVIAGMPEETPDAATAETTQKNMEELFGETTKAVKQEAGSAPAPQ